MLWALVAKQGEWEETNYHYLQEQICDFWCRSILMWLDGKLNSIIFSHFSFENRNFTFLGMKILILSAEHDNNNNTLQLAFLHHQASCYRNWESFLPSMSLFFASAALICKEQNQWPSLVFSATELVHSSVHTINLVKKPFCKTSIWKWTFQSELQVVNLV